MVETIQEGNNLMIGGEIPLVGVKLVAEHGEVGPAPNRPTLGERGPLSIEIIPS